ncbi:MAG: helix-hairpin-helix domain-containing protein [bacterium]|nr:helix-hairpin-helix domain-containing protein [bacterium]
MSTNQTLSTILTRMSELYQLGGDANDRYRIASYSRAAQLLNSLQTDIRQIIKENRLYDLSGIGEAIGGKIEEFLKTGKIQTYEKLQKKFPKPLVDLLDIPGLGPKKVHALWRQLGVTDKKSLKAVLTDGSAAKLDGFGEKSVHNILDGLGMKPAHKDRKSYAKVKPIAEKIKRYLEKSGLVERLEIAGSFRRKKETIGDLDFLAVSARPQDLIHYLTQHPEVRRVTAEGATKGSVILRDGQQVDLRVVKQDEWGAALMYFTGSKEHNVQLRSLARTKGMTINEYGLFVLKSGKKGKKLAGDTEEGVYGTLGLKYIPPEQRLGEGEIGKNIEK